MKFRSIALGAFYLALSGFFAWPLFAMPNATGWRDWDYHLFLHGAVLKNVVEYGQLPFWNPWYCGGNVLLQNPQVAFLSPVYPLAALMSLPLAMKASIVIHYWLGLVGMHVLLTRITGVKFLPAVVFLASAFTLSGAPAMHVAVGHANFLPAFYLPFLLYFFCLALETGAVKHAAIAGAILAIMVWNGGLHIVPMTAVVVGAIGLVSSLGRRDWRPLATASMVGVFGVLFAAPKVVPMLFFVTSASFVDARSPAGHPDLMTLEILTRSLIDPWQNRGFRLDGQMYEWFEYGNYVGLPLVLAAAASMVWILMGRGAGNRRFGLALVAATLAALILAAGEFSVWAPASMLAHLPFFSNFRIPSRYTIAAVLSAVMTVAWASRALDFEARPPIVRLTVAILCLLATTDLVVRNRAMLGGAFVQDPVESNFHLLDGPTTLVTDAESSPFAWGSPMLRALMSGQSFYRCYEIMKLAPRAETEHPLVWLDGDAKLVETTFSPNRVRFRVDGGREPSRVRLNQNFATGWSSDAAAVEPDPKTGQPSVVLVAGETGTFSFRFTPPGLFLGCGLLLLGIGAAAFGGRIGHC